MKCLGKYRRQRPKPYAAQADVAIENICRHQKDEFHSYVAKLLHILKHVRPNIDPEVGYLFTHVKTFDQYKLKRVLKCLFCEIDDERIIGTDGENRLIKMMTVKILE